MTNIILQTDSYKLTHFNQYPKDTTGVYSYFEARKGAKYDYTVFFGLQHLIKKYLEGVVVTEADLVEADALATIHFGTNTVFNLAGWRHIVNEHGGKLPVRIKAVKEGTVVPINNVMMTVENTCHDCYWLTNALESLLTHVWYSSTVATASRSVKQMMGLFLHRTSDTAEGLPFMLHDFGYRGVSSEESAEVGGMAHLVNFLGTDTLPALLCASDYYSAPLDTLGFSVIATEHSVMTAEGPEGEHDLVVRLMAEHPTGVLSVVADSYDIYKFVEHLGSEFKAKVLRRDGVFVVRPDSVTPQHPTPEALVVWILDQLWEDFGGTQNSKLYKVLDPHVRVIWGDGIDPQGIHNILMAAQNAGYSAENLVFGMGGGLLQKVNRDTQRFAFKCSARQTVERGWIDVQKNPLDQSKASKKGRLALIEARDGSGRILTINEHLMSTGDTNLLETVFENGELIREQSFDEIRELAS